MAVFKFILRIRNRTMKPTATLLLMIIALTASLVRATEPDPDSTHLEARDAITLSIEETKETKKFVELILKITHQAPDLKPCVDRLVYDLDAMESTLHQMRHLNNTDLPGNVHSLKKYIAHGVDLSTSCHKSFKSVDEIVPTMLTGKLDTLSMVIDAVLRHVSSMEGDVYRADTSMNPAGNS